MDTTSESSSDEDDFIITSIASALFAKAESQRNEKTPRRRPRRFGVHPFQRKRREQGRNNT
jgi:hypothetical protein